MNTSLTNIFYDLEMHASPIDGLLLLFDHILDTIDNDCCAAINAPNSDMALCFSARSQNYVTMLTTISNGLHVAAKNINNDIDTAFIILREKKSQDEK